MSDTAAKSTCGIVIVSARLMLRASLQATARPLIADMAL